MWSQLLRQTPNLACGRQEEEAELNLSLPSGFGMNRSISGVRVQVWAVGEEGALSVCSHIDSVLAPLQPSTEPCAPMDRATLRQAPDFPWPLQVGNALSCLWA